MQQSDGKLPGFSLANERCKPAGIDFVKLDIRVTAANMELHWEVFLACDVSASPQQVPLQHLISDARCARAFNFGKPVAGRTRHFARARRGVIDG